LRNKQTLESYETNNGRTVALRLGALIALIEDHQSTIPYHENLALG